MNTLKRLQSKKSWILLPFFILIYFGCGDLFDDYLERETEPLAIPCGTNVSPEIIIRITEPKGEPQPKKFALLMSPSPAIVYFSESGSQYYKIKERLLTQKYRIAEVKYEPKPKAVSTDAIFKKNPNVLTALKDYLAAGSSKKKKRSTSSSQKARGYYSLCLATGLNEAATHNDKLYEAVIKELGYKPADASHRLVGAGHSLGGIQLKAMAFSKNKKFDALAITGVMFGKVKAGYESGWKLLETGSVEQIQGKDPAKKPDGIGWPPALTFLAAAIVANPDSSNDYTGGTFDFDRQLYKNNPVKLGLFEGQDTTGIGGGLPEQALFIQTTRNALSPPVVTEVKLYSGPHCDHSLMMDKEDSCSQKAEAASNMVDFLLQ